MVAYTYHPSTQEAKGGLPWVWGQPKLQSETLSQKTKALWHMPAVPALGRLRQEDHHWVWGQCGQPSDTLSKEREGRRREQASKQASSRIQAALKLSGPLAPASWVLCHHAWLNELYTLKWRLRGESVVQRLPGKFQSWVPFPGQA